MKLNQNKCDVVKFAKNKIVHNSKYVLSGVYLEIKNHVQDLGVYMDSSLNFTYHLHETLKTSCKILNFVKRISSNFEKHTTMVLLYNSLVRSKLEYASQIWNPSQKQQVEKFEKIQNSS